MLLAGGCADLTSGHVGFVTIGMTAIPSQTDWDFGSAL